jgi:CheY-like chemotaxis protein
MSRFWRTRVRRTHDLARAWRHRLRSGLRRDVILLDLMMPIMDGWTFREEQSRDPELASIPVVVVTAAHSLHKPIDARAIVRKPFRLEELLLVVQGSERSGGA